jgi:hypothetical protein
MLDDETSDHNYNPQEKSDCSDSTIKVKLLLEDPVAILGTPEQPLTPTYLHESAHQKVPEMQKAPKPNTSVVQRHRLLTIRVPILSNNASSDISGLLAGDAITEGPSEGALDAEEYIRNIWQDYEYEVS